MAKREIQGVAFTKCEAFWDCKDPGETFTGVLIDINERFPDKMKGATATKPLYIFKSLGVKGEKPALSLDEKTVPNKKGLIVGVFDSGELRQKIYGHYQELLGCEVTVTYTAKEPFEKDGVTRTIKRMHVLADDTKHSEFGKDAIPRTLGAAGGGGSVAETGEVPFESAN